MVIVTSKSGVIVLKDLQSVNKYHSSVGNIWRLNLYYKDKIHPIQFDCIDEAEVDKAIKDIETGLKTFNY